MSVRYVGSSWLPVISLAITAFIFNTSEFMPIGLLSEISDSYHIPIAQTGLVITIYAWTVSCSSLPCMLLTRHIERRQLLTTAIIIFIGSHILSFVANSFTLLIIARIGVALSHAIFWAITASIAMRVAPGGQQTKALSLLVLGSSLALILGLPLGRMLSQQCSWRMALLLIGILAGFSLLLLRTQLPILPSQNTGSLQMIPKLMKRPQLLNYYGLTLLLITAHFCAYGYFEPFIRQIAHHSSDTATHLLLVFGISGLLASQLFERLYHFPFLLLAGSILLMASTTFLLLPAIRNNLMLFSLIILWGLAITWIGLCLQIRILAIAYDATDLATSLFSTVYNIGVGAGALLGRQVTLQWGLSRIGIFAALLSFIALGYYYIISGRLIWHSHSSGKRAH